ncbi:MAG: PAS domain-containing protein [Micrococcales bacterium]|nr:PAS domain-containing protein [Micrococcales bacterium]
MQTTAPRPTGVERSFGGDEVIVTKTDLKGRITYANEVFCRVSAFDESQMLGEPHNIIRHPDMPRGVFRLLWNTIKDRREMFAFVVNLAHDGAHYWVLAHITPSVDANGQVVGYHSNRRLPLPQAVRAIKPVYDTMLATERRHSNANEAAQAGCDLLSAMLAERGTDYDRFVWSLAMGDQ